MTWAVAIWLTVLVLLVSAALSDLARRIRHMSEEFDKLRAEVAAQTTVTNSAIKLLQGLKARVDAALESDDPVALADLSATIDANTSALAAAVAANTPVDVLHVNQTQGATSSATAPTRSVPPDVSPEPAAPMVESAPEPVSDADSKPQS